METETQKELRKLLKVEKSIRDLLQMVITELEEVVVELKRLKGA